MIAYTASANNLKENYNNNDNKNDSTVPRYELRGPKQAPFVTSSLPNMHLVVNNCLPYNTVVDQTAEDNNFTIIEDNSNKYCGNRKGTTTQVIEEIPSLGLKLDLEDLMDELYFKNSPSHANINHLQQYHTQHSSVELQQLPHSFIHYNTRGSSVESELNETVHWTTTQEHPFIDSILVNQRIEVDVDDDFLLLMSNTIESEAHVEHSRKDVPVSNEPSTTLFNTHYNPKTSANLGTCDVKMPHKEKLTSQESFNILQPQVVQPKPRPEYRSRVQRTDPVQPRLKDGEFSNTHTYPLENPMNIVPLIPTKLKWTRNRSTSDPTLFNQQKIQKTVDNNRKRSASQIYEWDFKSSISSCHRHQESSHGTSSDTSGGSGNIMFGNNEFLAYEQNRGLHPTKKKKPSFTIHKCYW